MKISQIRYEQQYQQLRDRIYPGVGNVGRYDTRDAATGRRIVRTADGGREMALYLSNSQPGGVLGLSGAGSIGLVGYASQKPH